MTEPHPTWTARHTVQLLTAPLIALNFHDVPAESRGQAEQRIRRIADLAPGFDPAEPSVTGPRLLVAFYDGYRDAARFGADLCHSLGIRAYFFPILRRLDGERGSATDEDLAEIATVHELCFHTATHRSAAEIGRADLGTELTGPLEHLTRLAGRPPRLAAWRGGTRFDPGRLADRSLRDAGITHLVSNWSVERL